ncbi:MAG: helix-turn-helix domain-containing protein [Pseudomonadota bacterium]
MAQSLGEETGGSIPISEFLRSELEREGWDKEDFAREIGVSRATVYNILSGSTKISRKNAPRIAEVLGHSHDFWMRSEVLIGADSNVVPLRQGELPIPAGVSEGNAPELLTDEMLAWAIREDKLSISGFNSTYLKSASYDLTLAPKIRLLSNKSRRTHDLSDMDYEIDHMESIAVSTFEEVAFSKEYMARVGPTAELAKMGVVVNTGLQIDPGFSGCLDASIVNFSGRKVQLFQRQVILSIEVFRLPVPPREGYAKEDETPLIFKRVQEEVLRRLKYTPLRDGASNIEWNEAHIDICESGTKDKALANAMNFIANKIGQEDEKSALWLQLDEVSSLILPTRDELRLGIDALMRHEKHSFDWSLDVIDRFIAGKETLRGLLRQARVPLNLFMSEALKHR